VSHWFDLFEASQPWLIIALQYLDRPFALVELFSTVCGLLGSLLLALKGKRAGWGWLAFAFSNAGWLAFANGHGHQLQFIQQIGFSITTLIGLWHWLIVPAVGRHFDQLVRKETGL
jgi:hypothetical protein